jgi:hypothetical protein
VCSRVGSPHRGQAGPSSTSEARHALHSVTAGTPHAAHCGRKIQSTIQSIMARLIGRPFERLRPDSLAGTETVDSPRRDLASRGG